MSALCVIKTSQFISQSMQGDLVYTLWVNGPELVLITLHRHAGQTGLRWIKKPLLTWVTSLSQLHSEILGPQTLKWYMPLGCDVWHRNRKSWLCPQHGILQTAQKAKSVPQEAYSLYRRHRRHLYPETTVVCSIGYLASAWLLLVWGKPHITFLGLMSSVPSLWWEQGDR